MLGNPRRACGERTIGHKADHEKTDRARDDLLRLDMPKLGDIASIIWAKWGGTFLEALRTEALDAADGLAFRAMNSDAGMRMLLIVCTIDRGQIQTLAGALGLKVVARPVDWKTYSVAEMVFKTGRGSGLGHQERYDESGGTSLVLCATDAESVRTLEKLCDLPA